MCLALQAGNSSLGGAERELVSLSRRGGASTTTNDSAAHKLSPLSPIATTGGGISATHRINNRVAAVSDAAKDCEASAAASAAVSVSTSPSPPSGVRKVRPKRRYTDGIPVHQPRLELIEAAAMAARPESRAGSRPRGRTTTESLDGKPLKHRRDDILSGLRLACRPSTTVTYTAVPRRSFSFARVVLQKSSVQGFLPGSPCDRADCAASLPPVLCVGEGDFFESQAGVYAAGWSQGDSWPRVAAAPHRSSQRARSFMAAKLFSEGADDDRALILPLSLLPRLSAR